MIDEATYRETLETLFDDPSNTEASDAMLVVGDALESAGDSRGERIALSEAIAREPRVPVARRLRRRLEEHVGVHWNELFDNVPGARYSSRSMRIGWRAGVAYSAALDVRYIKDRSKASAEIFTERALRSPALRYLRRLSVRTRFEDHGAVTNALMRTRGLPLEEVMIGDGPHPYRIATIFRRSQAVAYTHPHLSRDFLASSPSVWLIAVGGQAWQLPLEPAEPWPEEAVLVEGIRSLTADGPLARAAIGRGLWSEREPMRLAAVDAMGRLGCAHAFASSARTMLRADFVNPPQSIVEAIGALGPAAASWAPALRQVVGRGDRYWPSLRAAAGKALRAVVQ